MRLVAKGWCRIHTTGKGKARRFPRTTAEALLARRGDGDSVTTLNRHTQAVKMFARWVVAERRAATNPLAELLVEYQRHSGAKGNTEKQAGQTARRCERVFEGCQFVMPADLDTTAAENWLAEQRGKAKADEGIGPQTSNHFTAALKAFGNWLVSARRLPENPFRFLKKVNADVDVRKERRPLTAEEFARLLTAAALTPFRGLSGTDKVMLYTVASFTGLRASELASLTPASFAMDATPPVVTVAAAYPKHRREDVVPLHPELVGQLRPWLTGFVADAVLWPGKWAAQFSAAKMLRKDMTAARSQWLTEATSEIERADRERSDFLLYEDSAGRTTDFHALRHTFITNLVKAGVQPKDAKEQARHSTITLTMDRYAHVGLQDTAAAVGKLPGIRSNRLGSDAAPDAATSDSGGGFGRTNEKIGGETPNPSITTPALKLQAVEGERGVVSSGEGGIRSYP